MSGFLGLDTGEKDGNYMKKKKIKDSDMPFGKLTVMPDFLPPPEELFPAGESSKITIVIDKETVKFFKKTASKHGQKYQRIMREVLKRYAKKYGT